MMILRQVFFLLVLAGSFHGVGQTKGSQWRGPGRDGIYPGENLLKQWPEQGPELLWSFEGLGAGQGSAVVSGDRVFVTGIPDTLNGKGHLFSFDMKGKLLWKKEYGPEFIELFPGARSTPTLVDGLLYIESGSGKLYCLSAGDGAEKWSVDFFRDLKCDSVQFGFSESVLIDGDKVIFTPGGKENNMVALDRFTGKPIWSCRGFEEQATYTSPILAVHNGHRLIINLTATSIIGVNADTGEFLWRVPQFQDNKIHANTPVYHNGEIVVSSASRKDTSGLVLLRLSDDCRNAGVIWRNLKFINLSGGLVLKDGYVYGSAYIRPEWQCIDWKSGQPKYISKELGGGVVIYADGLFYCYTERDGEMALVEASPESFRIISKFRVPLGTLEHWAHPVIKDGRLYLRHGNALMAYKITS